MKTLGRPSDTVLNHSFRIRPDQSEVQQSMIRLREKVEPVAGRELVDLAELVLAEILNNITEHAFADRDAETGSVSVSVRLDGPHLGVEVVDNGAAMPGGTPPPGHAPQIEGVAMEDLPEGGFGWNLIHRLTDELTYARENGENRLRFRIAPESGPISA